ncbi:hypothetical protein [Novosphingobium sp. P6W]|uniref:hypothetical protein n=1 Tax=Novosphingobium sp. P6W TaxID=1609758 RepID=UPI0005C2BAE6|nr:hypothetical protein [Novosphingobium sp. P6W]AXB75442.1 hypothetical protein TQ38_002050 [Novosphingobium sp. P6W]KIS32526.1 hypothetical protein TQ38_09355 [Novosphingobium sp. P6W]
MHKSPFLRSKLASLRRGERWWPAEIVLRALGLALLAGCWRLAITAQRMAMQPAPHPASAADLAVCAGVVVLLCAGLMLGIEGPGLLRDVPLTDWFTHTRGSRS